MLFDSNRLLFMVKVKGYRVNEPLKSRGIFVCNCKWGHQNCNCDGKGNKMKRNRNEMRED
jgi:hypothetical protein